MAYRIDTLVENGSVCEREVEKGVWVIARPEPAKGFYGVRCRIKDAWLVFTGKADAVLFYKQ